MENEQGDFHPDCYVLTVSDVPANQWNVGSHYSVEEAKDVAIRSANAIKIYCFPGCVKVFEKGSKHTGDAYSRIIYDQLSPD